MRRTLARCMDASAYLRRQGWLGDGHSLDHTPGRTGVGLKKPLLVSKKVDVLGVGLNKHTAVSDQWWLRAFDQGLKDLGTGKESTLASVQKHGVNRGGLYGRFVRGEGVPGTIGSKTPTSTSTDATTPAAVNLESRRSMSVDAANMPDKKRKRDDPLQGKRAKRKGAEQGRHDQDTTESKEQGPEDSNLNAADDGSARPHKGGRQGWNVTQRLDEIVLDAQKQGIIPVGPNEGRKRNAGGASGIAIPAELLEQLNASEDFQKQRQIATTRSGKEAKFARESLKRILKRAAKAYLTPGDITSPDEKKAKQVKIPKKEKKSKQVKSKSAEPVAVPGEETKTEAKAQMATPLDVSEIIDKLTPEKLELYKKRAAEKGLSIEGYVLNREKKREKKHGEQQESQNGGISHVDSDDLGFVVDTVGDTSLAVPEAKSKKTPKAERVVHIAPFAQAALDAIGANQPFHYDDAGGDNPFHWEPQMPIPKDPRLWLGIHAKSLPKSVRKARKMWMADRRVERKKDTSSLAAKKKAKGERKVEARENFVHAILRESRKHTSTSSSSNSTSAGYATIDDVPDVPLIKMESASGTYKKAEVALARTVARRVLRNVKRAEKAEKGKGKGWKKAEKAQRKLEKDLERDVGTEKTQ